MSILGSLRDRFSAPSGSSSAAKDGEGVPFAGYDNLDAKHVVDQLSDHSQAELEAVESYERSHRSREAVLDKLRFMRGPEPLPGYDTLSVDEIVTALGEADLETIKKVRGYERKFANRRDVLEEVARVHHRRYEAQPSSSARAYQPTTYQPSSASPSGPPPEQNSGP
jgi:hypothetical protein